MNSPVGPRTSNLKVIVGIFCVSALYFGTGESADAGAVLLPCNRSIAVAGGTRHSLALRVDGSIIGWGQSPNGSSIDPPPPNIGFTAFAAGTYHSLGLRHDGTIVGWGWNSDGQLNIPVPNANFIAVAAGESHSLALRSDGKIIVWGCGSTGFLGHCNFPSPNNGFIAVAGGVAHSVGLKSDGTVVSWGCQGLTHPTPCDVPASATELVAIAAGSVHTVGLKEDGSLIAWPERANTIPPAGSDFVAIAAGGLHSLALRADGSIAAWGTNDYGESTVPAPNADFIAIAAGWAHSLGVKSDGTIIAWGWNKHGQTDVPVGSQLNCDDGIPCTIDHCDETIGACLHIPDAANCDDGLFCNGFEQCDPLDNCLPGQQPDCSDQIACTTDLCNASDNSCSHTPNHVACADTSFCNGVEQCDATLGCVQGPAVDCEDNLDCTLDVCGEFIDACVHTPVSDRCDDGTFCNGQEYCDVSIGCLQGTSPCSNDQICDELRLECLDSSIPTLGAWGMTSLVLLLLIAAKGRFKSLVDS